VDVLRLGAEHPPDYYHQIADLHVMTIHHGVLPSFGKRFLARLYQELATAPRAGVWGVVDNDRVLGFIAGCADVRAAYVSVLLRSGVRLAPLAIRAVLTAGFWRAVAAMFAYPFRNRAPEGARDTSAATHAELLAIAVAEGAQGRGMGTMLVGALECELRGWGVRDVYRVATNVQESASNAFYKKLGFTPCGTVKHHRLTLQMYEKHLRA
jgi:GNAT superfamily N-acetyltransferase